jgi:uncharacterized protein DUF1153
MADPHPPSADFGERAPNFAQAILPPPSTRRWNPKRKAQVVRAIEAGILTHDEACCRYRMALEELLGWERALCESGERGLRITKRIRPGSTDSFDSAWLAQELRIRNGYARTH